VGALIEALKSEGDSVSTRAAEALREITKEDFGQDYEEWTEWYKKRQ
jgi:hypothetical protein